MRPLLIALVLTACTLPHVAPAPRAPGDATATAVLVQADCSEGNHFQSSDPAAPRLPDVVWHEPTWGTGVIISERHVLTAAHVVACPIIPNVRVTLSDGRSFVMVVERDDIMYPRGTIGTDVARLEILSADRFGLHVAPPELASATTGVAPLNGTLWIGDVYCASTLHGRACGSRDLYRRNVVLDMRTRDGDSGAGVYNDADQLAGIVVGGGVLTGGDLVGTATTHYAPVPAQWLEGT